MAGYKEIILRMGVMDKFLNYMKLNDEEDDYYDDDYYDEPAAKEEHICKRRTLDSRRTFEKDYAQNNTYDKAAP